MADVRPFRGVRFNVERFGRDLAALVCPPFDVISPDLQSELYDRHPRNMVRLELTRELPGEDGAAKYQRAANDYSAWQADQTLVKDPTPAVYGYSCKFVVDGVDYERRGLIAALRLQSWEEGVVLPHERTLAGPIEDRMQLMRACRANFSPIWLVYRGAAEATGAVWNSLRGRSVDAWVFDAEQDTEHSLWVCTEPSVLAEFHAALREEPVYVADGHHRYTTALAFRDELRGSEQLPTGDAANFVLAHLVPAAEPGLTILGIHRLVRSDGDIDATALRAVLSQWFELDGAERGPAELLAELRATGGRGPAFAVWAPRLGVAAIARLRAEAVSLDLAADRSPAWRRLDAVALHVLGIDPAFPGGTAALLAEGRLTYAHSLSEIERGLETGKGDVAFFLRGTPIEQIMAVADARDRMPEKSTFFYPKPVTGAVMASLSGEVPNPNPNL